MTHPLLAATMAIASSTVATNFYLGSSDPGSPFSTTADQRRQALLDYLATVEAGDLVLVGEAAGWRGARQSGVPFTSAATVNLPGSREGSATVMHDALTQLNLHHRALRWNAFPLHPFKPGRPRTNRTPTAAEFALGRPALAIAVQGRRIICVGQKAAKSIGVLLGTRVPSVEADPTAPALFIRHPSYGGADEFKAGLAAAVA